MSALTNSDYENLLKFNLFINANYERFISRVLFYIQENFGYQLLAYTIFNKNSKGEIYVEEIYSESFHADSLQNYKNRHYKSDLFFEKASYKKVSTSRKFLYTIEDITTKEDFFASTYGQSLLDQNICSQLIVRGALTKTVPFHILSVFRSTYEGDFTDRDLELLNCIGNVFSQSVELYKKYIEHKSLGFYLSAFCDDQDTGLAVFDGRFKMLYHSESFLKFVSETYDITEYNNARAAITAEVIESVEKRYNIKLKKLTEAFCFQEGRYDVCFKLHHHFNGEIIKKLLFITVKKTQKPNEKVELTESTLNFEIFNQYNFSPREAEIVNLISQGYDNKKIAAELFISMSTAKFHIRNIFNKLGVSNRTAAIAKILKN